MSLTTLSILCFVLAALGGLLLAFRALGGRELPWALAAGHGALGAAGLIILILAVAGGSGGTLVLTGLAVLVLAALGGFYLLSFHVRGLTHPKAVILVHALAAVAGVGLLIAAVLVGPGA